VLLVVVYRESLVPTRRDDSAASRHLKRQAIVLCFFPWVVGG
jgi:hypothetical protein